MTVSYEFQSIPINIVGPSSEYRSAPASAQKTLNLYPVKVSGGINEFVLASWPGLKGWAGVQGKDRGLHVFDGVLYQVAGTTLYSVSVNGVRTSIGTITGENPVGMDNNLTDLVICNGLTPYAYDKATLTSLSSVTFAPKVVQYINNQFVFDGSDGRFSVADVASTSINGANYATPESSPDDLVRPHVFNQLLYNYSENSIEPWDNIGTGNPPFQRMNGAVIENIGLGSPYGVADTADAMYFIGVDGVAYRITSFQAEPISDSSQSKEFQSYTLTDIKAYSITFDSQKFCLFIFPSDGKCWVYSETAGAWFELDHGASGGRYKASSYACCYGKHLIADYETGAIYELDFSTYTNNGDPIRRQRTLAVIAGEGAGKPRQNYEMSKLLLSLEVGVGTTGQGVNPQIMIRRSLNGGKSWGKQHFIETGRLGEEVDVEFHSLAQSREFVFEITMTDPVPLYFYSAALYVREAGY